MSTLIVEDLKKSFKKGILSKEQAVLKGVSFKVRPGCVTGFLGANGAGKTTTMKCILGLIFPDSGKVTYFDSKELNSATKSRIGFLPERPYFYSYLTGYEFLKFYGEISSSLSKPALAARITDLLKQVGLSEAKDKPLRGFSKGMLQRIGLAQALIHEPELVILDEPLSGLDPDGRYNLIQIIRKTAVAGTSVFLSSHLLHDMEQLCEDLIILKNGRVHYEGRTESILSGISNEFEITYSMDGRISLDKVEDLNLMQKKIDHLRQKKYNILKIEQKKISLEKFFVEDILKDRPL